MALTQLCLIGCQQPWNTSLWTASDDTYHGNSYSNLTVCPDEGNAATFSGVLDTGTSHIGFASQRTVGSLDWNLADWDGFLLEIGRSDGKTYSLTVKDVLPANDHDASLLYEVNFTLPGGDDGIVKFPWHQFVPTYEGMTQPDAKPLNTSAIKRISIMMRSYYGLQNSSSFSLTLDSIEAFKDTSTETTKRGKTRFWTGTTKPHRE